MASRLYAMPASTVSTPPLLKVVTVCIVLWPARGCKGSVLQVCDGSGVVLIASQSA
jgi:hypothetical protein